MKLNGLRGFLVGILLLSKTHTEAIPADRLAGALMGSALGDAHALVTTNYENISLIDAQYGPTGPSSFSDFFEHDVIVDDEGTTRVLVGWPTMMSIPSTLMCVQHADTHESDEELVRASAQDMLSLYQTSTSDTYFQRRYHPSQNMFKAQQLQNRFLAKTSDHWWELEAEDGMSDADLLAESDAGILPRIWPLALIYSDQLPRACWCADQVTTMTHRHPTARAASAALVTGIASLLEEHSIDETIDAMVKAAEQYDRLERRIKRKARKLWARRHYSKNFIIADCMLTSDMIRYASIAAQSDQSDDEVLGYMSKRQDNQRSFRGFLLGYQADEAVAAAVYLLVKYHDDYTKVFTRGARAGGNAVLITSLAGALIGAHRGYDQLIEQGFSDEIAQLEKSDELYQLMEQVVRLRCEDVQTQSHDSKVPLRSLSAAALAGLTYEEAYHRYLPITDQTYHDLIKRTILRSEESFKKRVKKVEPVDYVIKDEPSLLTPLNVAFLGCGAFGGYLLLRYQVI